MKFSEKMAAVEAVLFACGEPIELEKLAAAAEIEKDSTLRIIERLNDRYAEQGSAVTIEKLDDSYQMMTKPQFARYIKTAMETRRQTPLSPAALEVLAIVAYNQPVTRGFVDQVRGVDSGGVMRSLVERDLLEEHGRLNDVPGRPIAYRTTDNFLRCFKLNGLGDLPPIPGSTDQITLEEFGDEDYGEYEPPTENVDTDNTPSEESTEEPPDGSEDNTEADA